MSDAAVVVGVVMGSSSDWETLRAAAEILAEFDIAHETRVTVGIRTPQSVQVTSGLKGGETVVTEGNYALPDRSKVEINAAKPE